MRSLSGHRRTPELSGQSRPSRASVALEPRGERGLVRYIKPVRGIIVFSAWIWSMALYYAAGLLLPLAVSLGPRSFTHEPDDLLGDGAWGFFGHIVPTASKHTTPHIRRD